MKAKRFLIAVLALLVITPAAQAQEQIKELFEKINSRSDIGHSGEEKTLSTDSFGINVKSHIVYIEVGEPNFHIFDKLQKAFDDGSNNATWTYSHIGDKNNSPRRQFSIWREEAEPIIVGNINNSSYLIANFEDKEYPNYRTCYAAEWNQSNSPLERSVKLVYVYGRKPQNDASINYNADATWFPDLKNVNGQALRNVKGRVSIQWPDDLKKRLQEAQNLSDSLFNEHLELLFQNGKPQDIPYTNQETWMNEAMKRVKHLSNSDWHRFFGLLTQEMIDQSNKKSTEDLVVGAGIVLDLCKNADQLDADERELSARRLEDVAEHYFINDKHQYIYDLLMLGAKKLKKK